MFFSFLFFFFSLSSPYLFQSWKMCEMYMYVCTRSMNLALEVQEERSDVMRCTNNDRQPRFLIDKMNENKEMITMNRIVKGDMRKKKKEVEISLIKKKKKRTMS